MASNEVDGGKEPLRVPTYEELKKSELYLPIVDFSKLNDAQLARAAQNKLAGDMDVRTFIYCWLHFAFIENSEIAKQFTVKSKTLDKGIEYIKRKLRTIGNGSVGIGEGKVIELFLEYLRLDDAQIAAEKAKAEAERKAKAAEKAKKAKEKSKKSKTSKKETKSSTAKAAEKSAKEKTSSKKASAPKAATDESVMSLFDMM